MSDARDPLADALRELLGGISVKSDAADFRAILARHGLVAVPVEPTAAMHEAGFRVSLASISREMMGPDFCAINAIIYRAMLAAAQEDQR